MPDKDSRDYEREPQNIEQGITNIEGGKNKFIIRHSLFEIRYSFLFSLSPYGFMYQSTLLEMIHKKGLYPDYLLSGYNPIPLKPFNRFLFVKVAMGVFYIIPPMPPMPPMPPPIPPPGGIIGMSSLSFGASATMASVVNRRAATEEAF